LGWPGWSNNGYDISVLEKIILLPVESNIKTLATKDDLEDLFRTIRNAKSDMIKWMFIFWLGQIGAMLGIVLWLR
jgi:hypothetical protein